MESHKSGFPPFPLLLEIPSGSRYTHLSTTLCLRVIPAEMGKRYERSTFALRVGDPTGFRQEIVLFLC